MGHNGVELPSNVHEILFFKNGKLKTNRRRNDENH